MTDVILMELCPTPSSPTTVGARFEGFDLRLRGKAVRARTGCGSASLVGAPDLAAAEKTSEGELQTLSARQRGKSELADRLDLSLDVGGVACVASSLSLSAATEKGSASA